MELGQQLVQLGLWNLYLNRLQSYLFHEHQAYTLQLEGVKYAAEHPRFREVMELLLTSSCIGPNSAALFAAELIDIRLFPTPNGLVRWAGLIPMWINRGFGKIIRGKSPRKVINIYGKLSSVVLRMNILKRGIQEILWDSKCGP